MFFSTVNCLCCDKCAAALIITVVVSVSAEKNRVGTFALMAYINENIDLPALGAAATIHT